MVGGDGGKAQSRISDWEVITATRRRSQLEDPNPEKVVLLSSAWDGIWTYGSESRKGDLQGPENTMLRGTGLS